MAKIFYVGDTRGVKPFFNVDSVSGLSSNVDKTDSSIFIGHEKCTFTGGTYTPTRIAQSEIVMRKTAAADLTFITTSLRDLFRTTADKGVKIKSVSVVYSISVAALVDHDCVVDSATFADNAAVVTDTHGQGGLAVLETATQANPYVTRRDISGPFYDPTSLRDIRIEVTLTAAATTVYDFYGFFVNYDTNQT